MQQHQHVCFIIGTGHSGSTLLGLLLGSHSRCFYGGEIKKITARSSPSASAKGLCRICGTDCPIWGAVGGDEQPIYPALAAHTGAAVVIDSAKNTDWIRQQIELLRPTAFQPALLYLRRDGRAVINSRIRKYPDEPVAELIQDWMTQVELTNALYEQFDGPKLALRYEQLSLDPAGELGRICELLGLAFEERMLRYYEHAHHTLAGNTGTHYLLAKAQNIDTPRIQLSDRNAYYYAEHPLGIRLDLRWKSELNQEHRQLFESLAGHLNQPFAWEG